MNIVFVGPSRCGKDIACDVFSTVLRKANAGTLSKYLLPDVAAELGVPPDVAYVERHHNRGTWFRIGNEKRNADPGYLLKRALAVGPILGGLRDPREIQWLRENTQSLIIWIDRDIPHDPTLQFSSAVADLIINNHEGLVQYYDKLNKIAQFLRTS